MNEANMHRYRGVLTRVSAYPMANGPLGLQIKELVSIIHKYNVYLNKERF